MLQVPSRCLRWQEWELDLLFHRSARCLETLHTCRLQRATHARGTPAFVPSCLLPKEAGGGETWTGHVRILGVWQQGLDVSRATTPRSCAVLCGTVSVMPAFQLQGGVSDENLATFVLGSGYAFRFATLCGRQVRVVCLSWKGIPSHGRRSLGSASFLCLLGPSYRSVVA